MLGKQLLHMLGLGCFAAVLRSRSMLLALSASVLVAGVCSSSTCVHLVLGHQALSWARFGSRLFCICVCLCADLLSVLHFLGKGFIG